MEGTDGPDLTLGAYYKLVWRTAKKLENWEWLKRVGGSIGPILIGGGILIIFGAIDLQALISGQRIGWFIAGVGLVLGGLGRMAWCLIRAPHQIHLEAVKRADDACAKRDQAIADRDALREPAIVPATVAHVRIEFHNFVKRGRSEEISKDVLRCRAWADEVLTYVQTALIDEHGDSLANVIRHVRSQTYAPAVSEAHALSHQCTNWLENWYSRITIDSLRPGFMVPAPARMTA